MKTIARLSLILFCSSLLLAQQRTSSRQVLVFTHVTLIDATGAEAKPDMTVVIRDGRIGAVGSRDKIGLPKSGQVVDASGKFLIPGLWDMHVHEWNKEAFFPLFIANGVIGVRDMFAPLPPIKQWRAEVAAGTTIRSPTIPAPPTPSGPNLTIPPSP